MRILTSLWLEKSEQDGILIKINLIKFFTPTPGTSDKNSWRLQANTISTRVNYSQCSTKATKSSELSCLQVKEQTLTLSASRTWARTTTNIINKFRTTLTIGSFLWTTSVKLFCLKLAWVTWSKVTFGAEETWQKVQRIATFPSMTSMRYLTIVSEQSWT